MVVPQMVMAGAGIVSSLIGGAMQSRAARRALAEQRRQFDATMAFEQQRLDASRANWQPLMDSGRRYMTRLDALNGFGTAEEQAAARNAFTTSPGYEWRRRQAIGDVERSAVANGLFGSGAGMAAVQETGDNLAAQEWDAWYRRQQEGADQYERGAMGVDNALAGASGAMGSARQGFANAAAQSHIAQGNAWAGAMNDAASWAGFGANAWMQGRPASVPNVQRAAPMQPMNAWQMPEMRNVGPMFPQGMNTLAPMRFGR